MTRYSALSRPAARSILLAGLLVMIAGLATSGQLGTWSVGMIGTSDLEFYREIVNRVHAGQGYYDSMDDGLVKTGFAVHSTFNWRLPTYAVLFASLPDPDWFYWLLLAGSLFSVIVTLRTFVMPNVGRIGQLVGTILLLGGTFSWIVYEHDAFLTTEPWCEVLILLSLCAYARGRWPLGMLAAVTALALRETVLPYCGVAAALAIWQRRRVETLLWVGIIILFVLLLHAHVQEIGRRYPHVERTSIDYWLHPSGLNFVLRSCVMNLILRPLPPELIAVYFPLALLGLAGWPGETGIRLFASAFVYVAAFMFVQGGEYWGYLYTPILVLGIIRSPEAMCDLWRASYGKAVAARQV